MVIKMSDYIMESCISSSDVSFDIVTEQADAEFEVASKIVDAYTKECMMLEYYYQEGDESDSSFGSKVKGFFGKIVEGIKHIIEAICKWFRTIFTKIKGLFVRSQEEVVKSTKDALANIPAEARSSFEVTITREDWKKYGLDAIVGESFDDIMQSLKIATRAIPVFQNEYVPNVHRAEEAIRDLLEAQEIGESKKETIALQALKKATTGLANAFAKISTGSRGSKFGNVVNQGGVSTAVSNNKAKFADVSVWTRTSSFNPDSQKKKSKTDTITFNYEQAVQLIEEADDFIGQNIQQRIDEISDRIKELEENIKRINTVKTYKGNADYFKNGRFDVETIEKRIEDINYELGKEATSPAQARALKEELKELEIIKANGGKRMSIREEERVNKGVSNDAVAALGALRDTLAQTSTEFREIFTTIYTLFKELVPKFKEAADKIAKGKKQKAAEAAAKMRNEEQAQKRRDLGFNDDGTIHTATADEMRRENTGFNGYEPGKAKYGEGEK